MQKLLKLNLSAIFLLITSTQIKLNDTIKIQSNQLVSKHLISRKLSRPSFMGSNNLDYLF